MNFEAAYSYVMKRLKTELSPDLLYHGSHHTEDVLKMAEAIAKAEGLNNQDILLAKTAALYHDVGFIKQYKANESIAVELAEGTLPAFDYTDASIMQVTAAIRATIKDVVPKTKLQQVMVDADFDYFGRKDYETIAATLFDELTLFGYAISETQWLQMQFDFLETHRYYTGFSIENRVSTKKENLSKLKERLSMC